MASDSILTLQYGGDGGDAFARVALVPGTEIGLRGGSKVDAILLNQARHGGTGGSPSIPASIVLAPDEFVCGWEIRHGAVIDHVVFYTNKKHAIGVGGKGGDLSKVANARLLAIGGRSGKLLDNLDLMLVENYQASTFVESVEVILSYEPPNSTLTMYEEQTAQRIYGYSKVTSHMLNQEYSASAEGEYYVKVSASTKLQIQSSTTETITTSLTEELKKSKTTTRQVPAGQVGVVIVSCSLMKDAGGTYWLDPASDPSFAIVPQTDVRAFADKYDLTGTFDTQVRGLKGTKDSRGFVRLTQVATATS